MTRPTLTVQQQIPVDKPATTRFEITNHVMESSASGESGYRTSIKHTAFGKTGVFIRQALSGQILYLRKMIAGIPAECQPAFFTSFVSKGEFSPVYQPSLS